MTLCVIFFLVYFYFQDIPHLNRLPYLRICILDEEDYVDLTERNFRKFVKATLLGQPKMKLKILDGTSPATKPQPANKATECAAKKELSYMYSKESEFRYMSPAELDIQEKEIEVKEKIKAVDGLNSRYHELSNDMNTNIWRDTSKRVCHNCHTRKGHDRKKCKDMKCADIRICGEIDLHPESKKELSVLSAKKQKLEGEVKALSAEIEAKRKAQNETFNTFEGKIQSHLIRSNPEKYLISATGQVRVNADTAILKKVYDGQVPDNLESSSQFWQEIIDSHDRQFHNPAEKAQFSVTNPVRRELENKGIVWPTNAPVMSPPGSRTLQPNPFLPQMTFGMPVQAVGMPFYGGFMSPPRYTPPSSTVTSVESEATKMFPPLPDEPPPPPPASETTH